MNNSVDQRKIIRHNTQSSLVGENREAIPIDLIIEILSRLPAKPIARFRCLSNQWASLLRSSYFTESFLTHSSARPRVLFRLELKGKWHFFTTSQPRNLDKDITVVADYHLGISGYSQDNCLSVNGFIYLLDKREVMGKFERVPVICNPSTGQHLTLPKVRARNIDLRSFFGYDPINKQFKVLCMTVANYRHQVNSKEHQVLTIGLQGKLAWRKIECLFPHYPDHKRDGICINGVLYYIARSKMTCMIACFDVRSERFSFIATEEDGSKLTYVSSLVNYKGKLGALTYVYGSHCVLWVLEDNEKEKWSKHTFVLPNTDFHMIKSIWATDTGEFAFVLRPWTNPFYVFYYNLERKSVRRVEIKGIDEKVLMGYSYLITHFTVTDHVENVMFL